MPEEDGHSLKKTANEGRLIGSNGGPAGRLEGVSTIAGPSANQN